MPSPEHPNQRRSPWSRRVALPLVAALCLSQAGLAVAQPRSRATWLLGNAGGNWDVRANWWANTVLGKANLPPHNGGAVLWDVWLESVTAGGGRLIGMDLAGATIETLAVLQTHAGFTNELELDTADLTVNKAVLIFSSDGEAYIDLNDRTLTVGGAFGVRIEGSGGKAGLADGRFSTDGTVDANLDVLWKGTILGDVTLKKNLRIGSRGGLVEIVGDTTLAGNLRGSGELLIHEGGELDLLRAQDHSSTLTIKLDDGKLKVPAGKWLINEVDGVIDALDGIIEGSFENFGQVSVARPGKELRINGEGGNWGTIDIWQAGKISFDEFSNSGLIRLHNGQLDVRADWVNCGGCGGLGLIEGSGTIDPGSFHVLTNSGLIRAVPDSGNDTLKIESEVNNEAFGVIEVVADGETRGKLLFDNGFGNEVNASITVNGGTVDIRVGGTTVNKGTITLVGAEDAFVQATGNIDNQGTITGKGKLRARVTKNGTIGENISVIAPGGDEKGVHGRAPDRIGTLTIDGDFEQGSAGELQIELGVAGHDVLAVTGDAELGGRLSVSLLGDFDPEAGAKFDILTANARSGEFATETLPATPSGRSFKVNYLADKVQLEVVCKTLSCIGILDGDE